MRELALSALVGCLVSTPVVFGLSLSLERRASGGPIGLVNRWTNAYTVIITVQDQDVAVAVDTGSSDLWIKPETMPPFQNTNIDMDLTYADGSTGVKGPIGIAPILLRDSDGRFKVDKQTFIAATTSTMIPISGVQGILGLGPERNSRVLPQILLNSDKSVGAQKLDGRPFLQNILEQQPESLRFFALELLRSKLGVAQAPGGSLWIAEHNPSYLSLLANAPHIPLYPEWNDRYLVVLEGLSVGGSPVQLESFGYRMAPLNHAVAMLDSGTPSMYLPAWTSIEYHSKIPGAVRGPRNFWIVPCHIPVVTVQFGGQTFPFHPLDLIGQRQVILPDGRTVRVCYSAFKDQKQYQGGQGRPDVWLGSPFLQNVYSVHNFQNNEKPFIQLISTTTHDVAASQPGLLWPDHVELPPAKLVGLVDLESLYNALFTKDKKVLPKQ